MVFLLSIVRTIFEISILPKKSRTLVIVNVPVSPTLLSRATIAPAAVLRMNV